MTDHVPHDEPPVEDDTHEAHEVYEEMDHAFDEAQGQDVDTAAVLAEASMLRIRRQAFWHGNHSQLFALLFANCLFFASAFAAWTRAAPGDPPGDPSTYITGLDTIRGALIFGLSIYGFWTAVFNLWFGQMKIWPYLTGAVLALWVGIAGFTQTIGSEQWERAKTYLDTLESKTFKDDLLVPLSTVAPGFWLLTLGGLVVVWVIIHGLMKGSQQTKAAVAREGAPQGRTGRRSGRGR